MKLGWDKKAVIEPLLKTLKEEMKVDESGAISCHIGIEITVDVLFDFMIHGYDFDKVMLFENFFKAIKVSFKQDGLKNSGLILKNFKIISDSFYGDPIKYVLLTSISLKNNRVPRKRVIDGNTISFYKAVPKKYELSRNRLLLGNSKSDLNEMIGYTFLTVSVEAQDAKSAYRKAMDTIDLIRSAWQLGTKFTINMFSYDLSNMYDTSSLVALGPIHTLHLSNGTSVSNSSIWLNERASKVEPVLFKRFELRESNLTKLLKNLNKNPFRRVLYVFLINYINALDIELQEFRFLKLWSVIEGIVSSDDSKLLIRRITFFYENNSLNKQYLISLRSARNAAAHTGIEPLNVELKNFKLCEYIHDLMYFFINNPFKYNKYSDVIKFISLTTDEANIDELIKNLKIVKRFVSATS